jgi:hypothetical protein
MLRVFENRVFRRLFRPKRKEVTREWIKPHNEELNDPNASPNIVRVIKSRRMGWAGHVVRKGEEWRRMQSFGGETLGKRPLGRPRRRWEDIKMDLQEVGYGGYGLDRAGSG